MTTTYTPAEVFPPGEYLRDELEERGWTVTEFAEIIGRPVQAVSEILNGKKEVTTETALALSEALGTTPELWLNLQTNYRLFQQRSNKQAEASPTPVARRARLRGLLPLAAARTRGWIPDTDDLDVLEHSVQRMLEIDTLNDQPQFALAARRANSTEPITLEQSAWLAYVRSVAARRTVANFDRTTLASVALDLPRAMQDGPDKLIELQPRLAECGVILVFAEGLRGGKLDGAVTCLRDGRPVIGLTTRGDRFDGLLFTLLHECAHLTLGHIGSESSAIVDDDLMDPQSDPREIDANEQATAWLFPDGFTVESTSVPAIVAAANRYKVHPSVVIGQLQRKNNNWKLHRTRIPKVRAQLAEVGALS
jgi:HTH-type transcriptional regulator / antitoxin HigA